MSADPAGSPGPPALGEPPWDADDPQALLAAFVDAYRDAVLAKLDGLDDELLRSSVLPSGWTPLELLWHLTNVERRWLVWGFRGDPVPDPWADDDPATGRWRVPEGWSARQVRAAYAEQVAVSRDVVAGAALTDRAATGGRFDADPPTLGWILLHLLQEHARHVGQLDAVRELLDGGTGE